MIVTVAVAIGKTDYAYKSKHEFTWLVVCDFESVAS